MDAVTAPATYPTTPARPENAGAAKAAKSVTGDFQTFLTLLTAQLRAQDPLNPADSTEFVAQLADFAGVEQQVQTNQKLDALVTALSDDSAKGLSVWLGMQVRAAASAAFDGTTPLALHTTPEPGAELAVLVVRDTVGTEVARVTVDPTRPDLIWAGEGTTSPLPAGRYSFSVESYRGGDLVASWWGVPDCDESR